MKERLETVVEAKKIRAGDTIEVTLLRGVEFDSATSSYPCAYKPNQTTEEPGHQIVGYVSEMSTKDPHQSSYLMLTPNLGLRSIGAGGHFQIYDEAIHSITKLIPQTE